MSKVYTAGDFTGLGDDALERELNGFRLAVAYLEPIVTFNQQELAHAKLGLALAEQEAQARAALKKAGAA